MSEVRLGNSSERGNLHLESIVFLATASCIRAKSITKQAVLIFQFLTDTRASLPDSEVMKAWKVLNVRKPVD